jgi:glycogen phosphorylase
MPINKNPLIAYFSMEFALNDRIPNFAGGLGVLAGDTIYSAADLGLPLVGISLFYHKSEDPKFAFNPKGIMKKCRQNVSIKIEDRDVKLAIWKMDIKGEGGQVPIYFLSANLPENAPWDRDLTKGLYAEDAYTRLGQEAILGVGGKKAIEVLGLNIKKYHMNECHSSLLALEILKEQAGDLEKTKNLCSFTSHTALDCGHDNFDYHLAQKEIGSYLPEDITSLAGTENLSMTTLALNLSKKSNGVSRLHRDVCLEKFQSYDFEAITNGIHHPRWIGRHMKKLFDKHIPNWHLHPENLSKALDLPAEDLKKARESENNDLITWLNVNPEFHPFEELMEKDLFDARILTIGFARRLVSYKRADLIFRNLERLKSFAGGKLQLVFAGNVYKNDPFSNGLVQKITECANELRGSVKIALIPRYNLEIAKRLVSGCDLWLNNPTPGTEASGTSGMKAALNGVPNLSTMDGWWVEAYKSDVRSGWGFGEFVDGPDRDESDFNQLSGNLENIVDCYYNRQDEWHEKMTHSIALLSYFNTYRMVKEYDEKMWG